VFIDTLKEKRKSIETQSQHSRGASEVSVKSSTEAKMRSYHRKIVINEDLNQIDVIEQQPKRPQQQRPVSSYVVGQQTTNVQPKMTTNAAKKNNVSPPAGESGNFIKRLFKKREDNTNSENTRIRKRDKLRRLF
jgi:hypothetical protein